jgi:hypothetical protein
MINVVVLGCGLIRTGEGAAAPFIKVHILGKIWPAGAVEATAAASGSVAAAAAVAAEATAMAATAVAAQRWWQRNGSSGSGSNGGSGTNGGIAARWR